MSTTLPVSSSLAAWPAKRWPWLLSATLLMAALVSAWWLGRRAEQDPGLSLSLLFGLVFGVVLQRSRFCFYCISRDFLAERRIDGLLGVIAALAVGTLGYHAIFGAFLPEAAPGRLPPGAHIGPVSIVLAAGALAFGLGMALAGSCVSALLYRLGEGHTGGLVSLAGVLAGFVGGFLSWNPLYLWQIQSAPILWLPAHLGYGGSLLLQLGLLGLLAWLLTRTGKPSSSQTPTSLAVAIFATRWPTYVGGILIAMLGTLAFLRLAPLGVTAEIGSVARTLGSVLPGFPERLEGLDGFRGCATVIKETLLSRNGVFVVALIAGAWAAALPAGDFKPTLPALRDLPRLFFGGVLMGWGGMLALGCTVGTLLSGIMAAAVSGWVFLLFAGLGLWAGWWWRQR
ncbi:YeeE/YedE family protein [Chitinimonas sp. BJYL2]|uniref:YeeE/YedE family protein n=1 Tax=Chitinimonas sp. BJYL2 TaxID=2976696 RepID=UPI0022B2F645|nr:YeeE/YedE family protein [Chitinimonas sp. BJYL2]